MFAELDLKGGVNIPLVEKGAPIPGTGAVCTEAQFSEEHNVFGEW